VPPPRQAYFNECYSVWSRSTNCQDRQKAGKRSQGEASAAFKPKICAPLMNRPSADCADHPDIEVTLRSFSVMKSSYVLERAFDVGIIALP